MTAVRVIDIETLGLEPADGICEIGWCDVFWETGAWRVGTPESSLINPERPIPPGMSAIHHIVDAMVANAPTKSDTLGNVLTDDTILAAHYATFEKSFLDPAGKNRWIDTWKSAIYLAPKAPIHSLHGLRYWLKLSVDLDLASPPHRAGPDAYVTACLLRRMLARATVEELLAITARPAILPYLTFGEWSMQPIENVPDGYLTWIINQGPKRAPDARGKRKGFDEDVRATAYHHLNLRRKGEST